MGVEYALVDVGRLEAFDLGKGWSTSIEAEDWTTTPIAPPSGADDAARFVAEGGSEFDPAYRARVVVRLRTWLEGRPCDRLVVVSDCTSHDLIAEAHRTGSRFDEPQDACICWSRCRPPGGWYEPRRFIRRVNFERVAANWPAAAEPCLRCGATFAEHVFVSNVVYRCPQNGAMPT